MLDEPTDIERLTDAADQVRNRIERDQQADLQLLLTRLKEAEDNDAI